MMNCVSYFRLDRNVFTLTVPKLHDCLQSTTTPVYGPVWISKGEIFSPGGAKGK